jgi:hypothetical protein
VNRASARLLRTKVGALLAFGLLATLSCQLILGVDEPVGIVRERTVEAGTSDPCSHLGPPAPPEVDDDPRGTSQKNYWIGMERVIVPMRANDAGVQPGADLDQSCTCGADLHEGGAPCRTPAEKTTRCDFEGGVDDALGALAQEYATALPTVDLSERVNRDIRNGDRTLLLYLASYNGKANDKDVGIAFVGGAGIYSPEGCPGRPHDAGPGRVFSDLPGPQYSPVWDGCDRWTPVPGQVAGSYPDRIAQNVVAAYVTDYTLVIHVKEVAIDLFGGSVRAGNAVAVAKLNPEGEGVAADGFIAGRMEFTELVRALGRSVAANTDGGEPLCKSAAWPIVGPAFCSARDTMRSPALDHTGEVCDAMTGTIGFHARPIQVADGQFQNPTRGVDCPDGGAVIQCDTP